MATSIVQVHTQTNAYAELIAVAKQLEQAKYIARRPDYVDENLLLGAWDAGGCVGFLLCFALVLGRDVGRPPIYAAEGTPLREGYVEAFGVLPEHRRHGIGQRLQERAIDWCREHGCYQIRSRSPINSHENYALKLKMGYAIHPSSQNDSYYFIKTLRPKP